LPPPEARRERSERGEGRNRRGGEGRRDRGERGDRAERSDRPDAPPQDDALRADSAMAAAAVPEGAAPDHAGEAGNGEERRERRSRDRYGRDRRERDGERRDEPRADLPGAVADDGSVVAAPASADPSSPRSYFARSGDAAPTPAQVTETAVVHEEKTTPALAEQAPAATQNVANAAPTRAPVAAPVPAPAARANGLPKVAPFSLPLGELESLAQTAGLQWVNSDADKIAAVQAAIAAEPRPIHVPRERPPLVELDEGPLVLVETRKDLRQVTLPFEQQGGAQPH